MHQGKFSESMIKDYTVEFLLLLKYSNNSVTRANSRAFSLDNICIQSVEITVHVDSHFV